MPLYEYACKKCGKVFEVMQKMSDATLTVHDECGGNLERLLSAPALHFKGSGFYITDYAKGSGGSNNPAKSEGGKPTADGGKSDGAKSEGTKTESTKPDSSSSSSSTSASTPSPSSSGGSSSGDSKS